MDLVIVESPTKAKTISKFLGHNYTVKSSYGHVRDLPEKKIGIDIKHDFQPEYIIIPRAQKTVDQLKGLAKKANHIILATDEDREGEAIAWHLTFALGLIKNKKMPPIQRIVFHEITQQAITDALKNPRQIDIQLVDAQQTRRILDRLVGYKLSPLLWKKIAKGLSAGRVQSVAVRLIVEREKEIQNFKSEEYWTIIASLFSRDDPEKNIFEATLNKIGDESLQKLDIQTQQAADQIIKNLEGVDYRVTEIAKKEIRKTPSPPFTTSTLQQEASKKIGFSPRQTMVLAQQLYEGIELGSGGSAGLITYMRTDSVNLAEEAMQKIRATILDKFGTQYGLDAPRYFKTKTKGAQEAHEAIRPTDLAREPDTIKEYLDPRQYKLYNLIWKRTIACQMQPAILDSTSLTIKANGNDKKDYNFKATGATIKFDGYLKIYGKKIAENLLPTVKENEILELHKLAPNKHFTQPPARYTEANLIKVLEDYGIGRPSTYAPILTTIQERKYVEKNQDKRLQPTEIGIMVNDLLVAHFPKIVDFQFTAKMEEDLDQIASGRKQMTPIIKEFYGPFEANLKIKEKEIEKKIEITDKICPKCGKNLVARFSRNGKFYACPGFPECRYIESIKPITKPTGVKCPSCEKGEIIERKSKKGKIFYGCDQYPQCNYALWDKPIDKKCDKCGSLLVETKSHKIKCPVCDSRPKNTSK